MAVLQKIRNRGKILIAAVGLALFAFIIEEGVRSISYFKNESHQRIGEVCGKSINIQEFNKMVDEYADVIKMSNQLSSLTDEQMSSIRDQVWGNYVQQEIVKNECDKLGLTVTDKEMQDIINEGKNPMLMNTPFVQNGRFDANALKKFLAEANNIGANASSEVREQYQQMLNYWEFVEKNIRQQTLTMKYQQLLAGAITSNPIAVKADFDARINESEIVIAALPYTSIKDADVTVDEKEMKAKFAEQKQLFETTEETRSIKYVDVEVTASKEDEANLVAELEGYATALKEGADAAKTVREAASLVAYSTLPIRKEALPHEVGEMLDSLTVGAQVGPFYHAHDNTYNIVRLIDKVTRPDSVEVRQIVALGSDMEKMQQTADSIINALNAGANFDSIAKKYDQPATKNWISSAQYEGQLMDAGNKLYIETISNAAVGSYNKIVLEGQAVLVVQVTDRRNMVSKYDVAVIKRAKDFSKDTYNKAFNDFSRFLAGNTTLEDIEANAEKEGYKVQTRTNISSTEHYVANVKSTREAMRWLFNEDTKINDISPLYECGDNDHLLCIVLTGINEKGYMSLDDEQVKSYIDAQIKKDKKAAILTEKMKNAKSVAEVAKMEGAVTDTIRNVSFAHNAFISKTGASEPALSGAVSKSKKGEFKACVKGNNAIYAYQVLDQTKRDEQFDAKKEMSQMSQINMRAISNYTQELYKKANVVDNRYIFY